MSQQNSAPVPSDISHHQNSCLDKTLFSMPPRFTHWANNPWTRTYTSMRNGLSKPCQLELSPQENEDA